MKKKAVFFDIDGTLWDRNNRIQESTVDAIRGLRQNGHLAFLCSGRTRAYINNPALFAIGFDGVVSGCGTMVECCKNTVYYKKIDRELAEYTVQTVRKYGFFPLLEGREYIYMDDPGEPNYYAQKLRTELGERLLPITDEWGRWEISKLTCVVSPDKLARENCISDLEKYYDFIRHVSSVWEMVPKGCHKGTGIIKVCEALDMDISDTFAFGDSANDMGMIREAGIGVAMGNGSDDVKEAADYVTSPMKEDGIWKACRHFGLI